MIEAKRDGADDVAEAIALAWQAGSRGHRPGCGQNRKAQPDKKRRRKVSEKSRRANRKK